MYKGKEVTHLPYNIEPENVSVNYTEFKGWQADLTKMTADNELPDNLNTYIDFIESALEVPIKIVSVGPDRKQTVHR